MFLLSESECTQCEEQEVYRGIRYVKRHKRFICASKKSCSLPIVESVFLEDMCLQGLHFPASLALI